MNHTSLIVSFQLVENTLNNFHLSTCQVYPRLAKTNGIKIQILSYFCPVLRTWRGVFILFLSCKINSPLIYDAQDEINSLACKTRKNQQLPNTSTDQLINLQTQEFINELTRKFINLLTQEPTNSLTRQLKKSLTQNLKDIAFILHYHAKFHSVLAKERVVKWVKSHCF